MHRTVQYSTVQYSTVHYVLSITVTLYHIIYRKAANLTGCADVSVEESYEIQDHGRDAQLDIVIAHTAPPLIHNDVLGKGEGRKGRGGG